MKAIWQRFTDWRHELRIKALAREYIAVLRLGKPLLAKAVWRDYEAAVKARSPRQWQRIDERKRRLLDPHAQAALGLEPRG